MEGEVDGAREEGAVEQGLEQQAAQGVEQSQRQEQPAAQEVTAAGADEDYQAQLSARDARIAELEKRVAEASESKAAAKRLTAEIEKIRAEAADERVAYELRLAGVRNVKPAKALLPDFDGDIEGLRASEPWLFAKHAEPSGTTGLEPAGAAKGGDSLLAHWQEITSMDD